MRGLGKVFVALVLIALAAPAAAAAATHVAVYLTTADLKTTLARQPDATFQPGVRAGADQISVNPATTYQTLTTGFGVAMTDSSAWLLAAQLPASARDDVMHRLFSRDGGIGLSFLRIPIGGSDYVVGSPYTYDDMPPGQVDPTLAHFSLAHDSAYVIPMIRQALALNPAMSVMANPWTPPAWMKTDDALVTTTGPAGQLEPQYYGAYADYLVRFLQGYAQAGVPVRFLGVQNEPLTPLLLVAGIPESFLAPQDEGRLIHDYVAPALARAGLRQTIAAFDDGYYRDQAYIPQVMALAGGDVGALAYHCYLSDPSSMSVEQSRYPQELELETECSSYLSNIEPAQMAIRSLRNWAQGIQLWNAALDQHYGPKIGNGCKGIVGPHQGKDCIAPVIVNTNTHSYSLTSDFWALAHFSKFIQLGAKRIDSTTPSSCPDSPGGGSDCGLEDVAFRNPDGGQVVVATAHDGQAHTAIVSEGGQSFAYNVPDGATVTFVWPSATGQSRSSRGGAIRLPSARRCRSSRRLVARLRSPSGDSWRDATIRVTGRRTRVVRIHGSRARIRVGLPGRSRRRFRVTVVAHTRSGHALRARRTYRRCA